MGEADKDTRERLIALEVKVDHLTREMERAGRKISEMHDLLQAARGAKWALLATAGAVGFVSAKLSWFIPWKG